MRDYVKILVVTILGFIIAVLIYPMLHELGHYLGAKVVGAKVFEVKLFPVAYVSSDISDLSVPEVIFVGLGGNLLTPMLIGLIHEYFNNNFYIWYTKIFLGIISIMASVISIISIIQVKLGNFELVKQDDMAQLANMYADETVILVLINLLVIVVMSYIIVKNKPLHRMYEFICQSDK